MKILLIILVSCLTANAEIIKIKWETPKNSDVAGYFFVMESENGVAVKTDIGFRGEYSVDILEDRYYTFKVIPYGFNREEGLPSNIIKYKTQKTEKPIVLPKPLIRLEK